MAGNYTRYPVYQQLFQRNYVHSIALNDFSFLNLSSCGGFILHMRTKEDGKTVKYAVRQMNDPGWGLAYKIKKGYLVCGLVTNPWEVLRSVLYVLDVPLSPIKYKVLKE